MFESYEQKQEFYGKIFNIVHIVLICFFSIFAVFIFAYNILILVSHLSGEGEKTQDFNFIDGNYLVEVSSNAWNAYYSQFSLLFVEEKEVNYENVIKHDGKSEYEHVYLFRNVYEDGGVTYSVGAVISTTKEACVVYGDKHVKYEDIIGEVRFSIPVVAIFGDAFFMFIYLFLLISYLAFLYIFSTTQMGYDILFTKHLKKELKKNNSFGISDEKNRVEEVVVKMETSEEIVQNALNYIISDFDNKNIDNIIDVQTIKNALLVLGECDFSSKEKVFVYLASINLLNAYTKKPYALESLKKKYFFKKYVNVLIDFIVKNPNNDVKAYLGDGVVIIECMGMQFSFHGVKLTQDLWNKEWSQIKLQPYADYIFHLFYDKEFAGNDFSKAKSNSSIMKYIKSIEKSLKNKKE